MMAFPLHCTFDPSVVACGELVGENERAGDAYPKKEQQREYGCVRGEWWWVAWVEELESLLATGSFHFCPWTSPQR